MSGLGLRNVGVQAALLGALLFGAGTPLAKLLLGSVSPWLLAGLLYLGSGVGLGLYRLVRRAPRVHLARGDRLPLAGAVLFGGVIGPVLLMAGLTNMPATGASLLLNAEGVFTALLAWFVFKENFDRQIVLGMCAIIAGAVVLAVPEGVALGSPLPTVAILGACLAWGIDNNLTRKVALTDASWIAAVKGLVAGPVNLVGPRPVVQQELDEHYGAAARAYLAVRPGLTGAWQVSGRSSTSFAYRVRLDEAYVSQPSLRTDLATMLKTVRVVLLRDGAC